MREITISHEESLALERVMYEKRTIQALISFFVCLCCGDEEKKAMLDTYISEYREALKANTLHEVALMDSLLKEHIPVEHRNFSYKHYDIDFDLARVVFYD